MLVNLSVLWFIHEDRTSHVVAVRIVWYDLIQVFRKFLLLARKSYFHIGIQQK